MPSLYTRTQPIYFGHCDPAGIVYYPRYFEMLTACIEDWFTRGLGIDYAQLLGPRRVGLPTVQLEAQFHAISRMGEVLTQQLSVRKLGRTSLALHVAFAGPEGDARATLLPTLVCTSLETHRPQPFPPDVQAALAAPC